MSSMKRTIAQTIHDHVPTFRAALTKILRNNDRFATWPAFRHKVTGERMQIMLVLVEEKHELDVIRAVCKALGADFDEDKAKEIHENPEGKPTQ